VVTGKEVCKNLKKQPQYSNNKVWNTPQIKTVQKSDEHRLIWPKTQHREQEHRHLKF
jgi:hypothetical protein